MRGALPLTAALFAALTLSSHASEEPQSRIETLSAEAARIAAEMETQGREASRMERELAALTAELTELARRENEARKALAESRARLRALLGALASLSRAPEPALLAHPDAPLAAARATILLERIGPALIEEARGVEAALGEIAELRADRDANREKLAAAGAELAQLRAGLEAELGAVREELAEAEEDVRAAISAQSLDRALKSARAFEAALARSVPDDPVPDAPAFAAARGGLTPPLSTAAVSARYGAAPDGARTGAPRQGLWLQGEAHGAVLAPWSGEILFAGPFRRLGNVIILEPETGYLIVLGGIASLSSTVGEEVRAGDVIGRLGGPPSATEEFLIEMTRQPDDVKPDAAGRMLYMEVRENGMPTDPRPWLRANEKVSGL